MSTTTDSIADALARIVRGDWKNFASTVVEFGEPAAVGDTKTFLRCHFIRSDPNGKARVSAMAEQLANQVVFYCLPRSRIEAASKLPFDRQVQEITQMTREATDLFTTTQLKTGEGAELLLYALVEQQLKIPQILSKMSLKTSTEVQYQGADGVHATFDEGVLALYWGEAKLYESVADAMSDCLDSIAPYLKEEAHKQDVFLVKHHMDLGDQVLQAAVLKFFDDKEEESALVEMRGACLIGFTHDEYPKLPADIDALKETLEAKLEEWRKGLSTRVTYRDLQAFAIEVFFVPVPSAKDFREAVKRVLRLPPIEEKFKPANKPVAVDE